MLSMPFYQFKTRSPPASLSFKGQATKQTTVKMVYYIIARSIQVIFPVFYSLILMFSKQVLVWLYSFDCFFKMEKSVCNYNGEWC